MFHMKTLSASVEGQIKCLRDATREFLTARCRCRCGAAAAGVCEAAADPLSPDPPATGRPHTIAGSP